MFSSPDRSIAVLQPLLLSRNLGGRLYLRGRRLKLSIIFCGQALSHLGLSPPPFFRIGNLVSLPPVNLPGALQAQQLDIHGLELGSVAVMTHFLGDFNSFIIAAV
jgi:hypothetical protein